ncbi:bifunctional (p)ppGpp synthetase/guanosine-3',5'-bis(diphosphate) 3'-pyrophosphohydrolase [Persephonella atlantica]|uniref:Bifunctional (P)ppGpp synthetase/guanosine-3',5'-bis(Diphosphate) 3'-pyrophosphohydrolase n=1 Tax=Persephonella atlantica TaxID=2699429 RepID=A0ABS1GFB1_9AQUI|nr:bifunctional (p)ppGpp synthetase/guanosine-3',5'-bis(diphosphate) 3'-pyrophosphohydrolase [Persephonella atlantica]MBK3331506.1 bifunctional (p)ppGpp synthetase/guanosine-3',5'-bis(diphosphate) 3'-pyrophosphohydrolase [Persephonella atlantica]
MIKTLEKQPSDELINKLSYLTEDDIEEIKRTVEFIKRKHEGQFRKSGEPYYIHPIEAAKTLAELKLDKTSIIAALLHDVVEDTDTTLEEIREHFGDVVAKIVDGVTKIGKYQFQSREEAEAENFRKMIVSMAEDIRVILVKLADRLHNIRTLDPLPEEKKKRIARETLEIYAPLAARLGLWRIKSELEDRSFMYTNPEDYKKITTYIAESKDKQERFLSEEIVPKIKEILDTHNIKGEIQYRTKHIYSIYEKTIRKGISLSDIYDIYGIRIILNSVKECYLVLGLIHSVWSPVPGRFKDYISLPKSNMYQALHTTVVGPRGKFVEIQIKTHQMHRIAEEGIAAHWRYKGGKYLSEKDLNSFTWLRNILDSIKENSSKELISSVKGDLSNEEIFVFTPKGDLIKLPFGSTPVDFAYAIHTQVGHRTSGAKVNGKLVPLDTKLKNGDVVEIITAKYHKPSRDWLKFVVTSKAKTNIKQYLSRLEKKKALRFGEKLLDKFLKKTGMSIAELTEEEKKRLIDRFSFKTFDDFVMAVGEGKISPNKVVRFLRGETVKQKSQSGIKSTPDKDIAIEVDGISNILSTIAKCCCPIPGDEILGVIVKGKGISIHSKSCPNAQKILETEPERAINAVWKSELNNTVFPAFLRIITKDKPGLLASVSSVIASTKTNISGANIRTRRDGKAVMDVKISVKNLEHLQKIIRLISSIKDVEQVMRVCKKNNYL